MLLIFALANAYFPIDINSEFSEKLTFSSLIQFSNAASQIFVTLDGMVIFTIFELQKAASPIIWSFESFGNSTFFKFLHPLKVSFPIMMTLEGTSKLSIELSANNISSNIFSFEFSGI